jgi:superfamily I DNA/RNA helicase
MADRIEVPTGVASLASTEHYDGPKPGRISVNGPSSREEQIQAAAARLRDQVRVYADMIKQGDRLGVIVPRRADRDLVHTALENDPELQGLSQVVRARDGTEEDRELDTALDPDCQILILTAHGAKGLEFRGVQWLFSDDLKGVYTPEVYYTVVTRAKTSLDMYFSGSLPDQLAKAYAPKDKGIW